MAWKRSGFESHIDAGAVLVLQDHNHDLIWPRPDRLLKLAGARKLGVCELGGSVGVLVAELRGTVGMAVDGESAAVQVESALSSIMATAQPIHRGKART
jgi:hypothetical protein